MGLVVLEKPRRLTYEHNSWFLTGFHDIFYVILWYFVEIHLLYGFFNQSLQICSQNITIFHQKSQKVVKLCKKKYHEIPPKVLNFCKNIMKFHQKSWIFVEISWNFTKSHELLQKYHKIPPKVINFCQISWKSVKSLNLCSSEPPGYTEVSITQPSFFLDFYIINLPSIIVL